MELDKIIIENGLNKEALDNNVSLDHGTLSIYVLPANNFGYSTEGELYDKNNEVIDSIFLMELMPYLQSYFKYNASKRIANKLIVDIKDGLVVSVKPVWDQSLEDKFIENLPASKRKNHIGWYDRE